MSFRNRPTLDRRHRPRWQDELRSQQLIVAGFAIAIAIAIGIFGAASWSTFYNGHLREVARVGDVSFDKDQLSRRTGILVAGLEARGFDLSSASGGANDAAVQQQLQALQTSLQSADSDALDSLTTGAYMRNQASRLGISVSDDAISKEVSRRGTLPFRIKLSAITLNALPANAAAGTKPTAAQWAAAEAKARSLITQVKGGSDFGKLAKAQSADTASAKLDGLIGWVQSSDPIYAAFFTAAKDGKAGEIIGPVKGDVGYAVLKVEAVRKATADTQLKSLLAAVHASDADYREYLRDELLQTAYQAYFGAKVVGTYMPQRNVAQIVIQGDGGTPILKQRIRHILIQPQPGTQDQTKAAPAQWAAALATAKLVRADLLKPNADWNKLAKEFSEDPGSNNYGGDLGWYSRSDASTNLDADFVAGLLPLKLNQISQPVKTKFGYHIIQVFEQRNLAQEQANKAEAEVKGAPNTFAAVAARESSDHASAAKGGDIGWVAPYEKDETLGAAIFALTSKGQISPAVSGSDGQIYIFKLLDISPARYVDADRLASLKSTGYPRWRDALKAQVGVWVAPELQTTQSTATG
ncbi:MAG: peptidylprolyl isomerase [Chloroflexota bacterium]|nr:peptidylprolyl isomerase [Chloroflexota bacterium]